MKTLEKETIKVTLADNGYLVTDIWDNGDKSVFVVTDDEASRVIGNMMVGSFDSLFDKTYSDELTLEITYKIKDENNNQV